MSLQRGKPYNLCLEYKLCLESIADECRGEALRCLRKDLNYRFRKDTKYIFVGTVAKSSFFVKIKIKGKDSDQIKQLIEISDNVVGQYLDATGLDWGNN